MRRFFSPKGMAGAAAGLCFFVFLLLFLSVYLLGQRPDEPQKSDCIIICGARAGNGIPSEALAGRLDRALALYQQGYGKAFILCGAVDQGETISEAAAMRDYLLARGIPAGVVFMDELSRNTRQNLEQAKIIMARQGFASAVVCTSDFHGHRALALAHDLGIQATLAKARNSWNGKIFAIAREAASWIKYYLKL